MSEDSTPVERIDDPMADLRTKAEMLEQKLAEMQAQTSERLIRAELKVEAVRAGMVDLDGLRLLDIANVKLNECGELEDAAHVMAQFRKAKPWLFGTASSSSAMSAPSAQPMRQKLATEMTDTEYRAARAALLKEHT